MDVDRSFRLFSSLVPDCQGESAMDPDDLTMASSVQWLLDGLKANESTAQQAVWNRYFAQLAQVARRRLERAGAARRVADEEDIVVSVFDSLFERVRKGEFGQISDELGLWKLLLTLTQRKVLNQGRMQRAQKRGGAQVRGDSVFMGAPGAARTGLDQVAFVEPTNAEADAFIATIRESLEGVDQELSQIGELRLCGFTNEEIATRLSCSLATVERRLKLLRRCLEERVNAP